MKKQLLILMLGLLPFNALAQMEPCPAPVSSSDQVAALLDGQQNTLDASARLNLLDEVTEAIRSKHVNPQVLGERWEKEVQALRSNIMAASNDAGFYQQVRDLVGGLQDHHTHFLSPAEVELSTTVQRGQENYFGLGMQYNLNALNQMQVTWVYAGSPAEEAGLKMGDVILSANGKTCPTVVDIRGPEGTEVVLNVLSQQGEVGTTTAVRGPVSAMTPRLITRLHKHPEILYVRIDSFAEIGISVHVRRKMTEALRQGEVKGLVLDLRQNGGGLQKETDHFLSAFLPDGQTISMQQGREGIERVRRALQLPGDADPIDVPLAVLIGPATASGGELSAEVLRAHKGAVVLGQPSANQLSSAFWIDLPVSGAQMRVTGERLLLEDGTLLGVKPVQPDVVLPGGLSVLPDQDETVAKAVEILLKR